MYHQPEEKNTYKNMPEGPDVASMVKLLIGELHDCVYELGYNYKTHKSVINLFKDKGMYNSLIRNIYALGKKLIIEMDCDFCIVFEFKLAGYIYITDANSANSIEFKGIQGYSTYGYKQFRYRYVVLKDSMNLATISVKKLDELHNLKEKSKIICMSCITVDKFSEYRITNPNKSVGALLVDQKYVLGIGNRYRNELLFVSRIHPKEKMKDLTDAQITTLIWNMHDIFNRSSITSMRYSQPYNAYPMIIHGSNYYLLDGQRYTVSQMKIGSQTVYYCKDFQVLSTSADDGD